MNLDQQAKNLSIVRKNGNDLEHIREQTHEICLAAIWQDANALQFVIEQTPEHLHGSGEAKWATDKICEKSNTRNLHRGCAE